MKYVIRGLSFLIIPIIVSGVLALLRQPKKAEKGKVYLPKFFVILGLICSAFFLIPTIITAFSDEPIWVPIVFFCFSLLGGSLIVAFVNCRVSYDEDGFVAKNFFGIKRKFTYDQVTAIKENMHENYIFIGTRKVMIDEFSEGGSEFIAYVGKRYRKIHNGQPIPRIHKTKHDIFNGNVEDVFGFVFVYILVSVAIVAFLIFIVWYIWLSPNMVENTEERLVSFSSCTLEEDFLEFTSSDGELYELNVRKAGTRTQELIAACDGKDIVTVYVKKFTPEDEAPYYSIKAIRKGETYLLSFEETSQWHQKEYWPLILFPLVAAIAWGGYIAGSIIVGRNPQKYSKRVIALFFKDGYVKKQ